ncbi:Polarized growth protein rax2 [Pleurostoma richardsiae]|uniref:Polarized growth protein rax2 n=1 Tax=Pleurostoma richardsiae TaxID=41990 RepID=A0AA38RHL4_9PEZI|nr:Polarized growth protein rax2 [Pleurostoma richardsiae]
MRLPLRWRHGAQGRASSIFGTILTFSSFASIPISQAISFTPAPPSNVDLSDLGQVGIAGDFTGISLFQFEEQNENSSSTNGTQSLLVRLPNGVFAPIVKTDASIQTMCTFITQDGAVQGVIIGGNFTSLADSQSTAIALYNINTTETTPLAGLSGQVNSVLCDQDTNAVYVGGNFKGADSTNAIAWVANSGWTNLPFAGFNGPVTSITKASNGHIIFGGSFTGLGNATTPTNPDEQIINLSSANITTGSSTTTQGFSDPQNIICKTSGEDGSGNTWLLEDNTAGFWQATMNFGFQPTKLRLYNTHQDGRGTRTWRFTALPLNGIMNFTYIDPATGQNTTCTSECPLSNNSSLTFQDFHFVNVVGMNEFRIDISAWYGSGGGLNGIELFENDIFAYAINDFNEPSCAGLSTASNATQTGPWVVTPSHNSNSEYLTAQLTGDITSSSASVEFSPDIRESGYYSVNMYTPGCRQDNTCGSRGQVDITGTMAPTGTVDAVPINTTIYQTNDFDKYDQIYFGFIEASSSSFRPTVTMTPKNDQGLTNLTFVAQRVGFTLLNSTSGLNGLFEYDPTSSVVNASDFENSAFDELGMGFSTGSAVTSLVTSGHVTYIGGNFTSSKAKNIVAINSNDASTNSLGGGLNGQVLSMYVNGTSLYVGGSFSNTLDETATGLNNVALYDTSKDTWSPLGAGVDGLVRSVVPLTMNVTGTSPELVISVTGDFTQLEAFDSNEALTADGFGIWVPSQGNWLRNLNLSVEAIDGMLSTSILDVPGGGALYAGSLSSSSLSANGASTLSESLGQFPVKIQASAATTSSSLAKRATLDATTVSGVVTGAFYSSGNRNITILGGHFSATASNGSTVNNVVFINSSDSSTVVSGLGSGITEASTFVALAVHGDDLFAGGNINGTVNGASVTGLVSFNLLTNAYNTQPPSLNGGNNTVTSIEVRPNTGDVYVGGSFESAGSLGCPAVCLFSTSTGQWNRPGLNLAGAVSSMAWSSDSTLVAGGNLTVNDTSSIFLASYDASKQTWTGFSGVEALPGPVDVLTAASSDGKQIWVAGTASNGSVYLMKYDGSDWNSAGETLESGTDIRSLQMFSLTEDHDDSPLVDNSQVLVLTGHIVLPGFGSTSAALFNGTTFSPYVLTTNTGDTAGTIAKIFTEKQNFFSSKGGHHLPLVAVVLISLGIALVFTLLLVLAGLLIDRIRKKREGYVPAPTSMFDRGSGLQRIPPQELLQSLGQRTPGVPRV